MSSGALTHRAGMAERRRRGKFHYVINGNMIAGSGLVAGPVRYGVTGVKTLVMNRNGIVYQANLGEDTEKTAAAIRTFNPSDDWAVVQD